MLLAVAAATDLAAGVERRAQPSLGQVLARAGAYAVAYGEALANVIADEEFVQELALRHGGTVLERRQLASEIAFLGLAGTTEWLAFRHVLRVDGEAVSDAAGGLERLFRETPRSALAQARAIANESARHNLGPVQRNFNVPTTVLQFILPQHQDRFRFRKVAEERADGGVVWIVEFRERGGSTFIRTPQGRPARAEGRLWIDPSDGRVVRSRLQVRGDVHAEIEVAWQHDGRLGVHVPAEMREAYQGPWRAASGTSAAPEPYIVRGVARYANFRRFEVDVRLLR